MKTEWEIAAKWTLRFRENVFILFYIDLNGHTTIKHWILDGKKDLEEFLNWVREHDKQFVALLPFSKAYQVREEVWRKGGRQTLSYIKYFKTLERCIVCNNSNLTFDNGLNILYCSNCQRFFLSPTIREMD